MTKKKYYTNKKGEKVFLTTSLLEKAVALKLELQKVNGNCKWSTVARILRQDGYDGVDNSEGFRLAVREYQRKIGKLPTVKQYKDKNIENKMRLLREQLGELSLAKRDLQTMKRDYNKIKRELNDKFLFREELLKSVPTIITPENLDSLEDKAQEGETLIVTLSDIHVGLKTKNYNYDTLKSRIAYYLDYIKQYINTHKVEKIIIQGLGDYIEGAYMHNTQLYELEFNFAQQVTKMLSLVIAFIIGISETGIKTQFSAILGNHDRSNGTNKKDNLFGDSIADILNETIKERASELRVEYIEPYTVARNLITINNINIASIHGDLDSLKSPSLISKLSSFFGVRVDIVLAGHLHSFEMKCLGLNQYLVQTSSAFDGNSYSDMLGVKNTPGQFFASISKEGMFIPHFVPFV